MQFRGTTCLHTKYWNKLYHCNYVNCSPILAIAFVLKSTKKIYALWWERISWIFPGCLQEREVLQKPVFGEIKLFTSAASLSVRRIHSYNSHHGIVLQMNSCMTPSATVGIWATFPCYWYLSMWRSHIFYILCNIPIVIIRDNN